MKTRAKSLNFKLTAISVKKIQRKTQENNYFVSLAANWLENKKSKIIITIKNNVNLSFQQCQETIVFTPSILTPLLTVRSFLQ